MGVEIERKFLVRDGICHTPDLPLCHIRQGYLTPPNNPLSIRIFIVDQNAAVITLKSTRVGLSRDEYEYPIPLDDGPALIETSLDSPIKKIRFIRMEGQIRWEIDRFEGENAGLVIAEIELADEDALIDLPQWIGEEVSVIPAMAMRPYHVCPSFVGELAPRGTSAVVGGAYAPGEGAG